MDPKYDELKLFVLREAQTSQMRAVYDKERAMREGQPIPESSTIPRSTLTGAGALTSDGSTTAISSSSPSSTPPTSPISAPNDTRVDCVDEFTKQIAKLSLLLQAGFPNWPITSGQGSSASDASRSPRPSAPGRSTARLPRCIWCDSTEHFSRDCAEFTAALNAGVTRYNDKDHLVNDAIGEELSLMFEKDGMKKVIQGSSITASTRSITVDEFYGYLGGDSVFRITLDFEEGTRTDEIMDVDVAEKRKFDREPHRRQIRSRRDVGPSQILTPSTSPASIPSISMPTPQQSQSVYIEEVPDEEMSDVQSQSARQSKGQSGSGEVGKKYYLDSKLGQNVKTTQIGEKIIDTPMQLSMREILVVSGDVANYIHDQTKKHRISIEDRIMVPAVDAIDHVVSAMFSISSVNVNSASAKSYYTLPSGRAKVILDDRLSVNATFDNGSKVNIMPRHVFERLDLPIYTEIRWRINAYDNENELEVSGPIDVCHDVPINLGGIEVK